jgi:hypothetical protein
MLTKGCGYSAGVPTTVAGGRPLMQLEPFYRVSFTTPESCSVTREGMSGTEDGVS